MVSPKSVMVPNQNDPAENRARKFGFPAQSADTDNVTVFTFKEIFEYLFLRVSLKSLMYGASSLMTGRAKRCDTAFCPIIASTRSSCNSPLLNNPLLTPSQNRNAVADCHDVFKKGDEDDRNTWISWCL